MSAEEDVEEVEVEEVGYRQSDPASRQKLRAKQELITESTENRGRREEQAQQISAKLQHKVTEAFVPPDVYQSYLYKWLLGFIVLLGTMLVGGLHFFPEFPWWGYFFPLMPISGLSGVLAEWVAAGWLRRVGPEFETKERVEMASAPFATNFDSYLNEMAFEGHYVCYRVTFLDEVPEPTLLKGLLSPEEAVSMVDETLVVTPPKEVLPARAYAYFKATLYPVLLRLHEGFPLDQVTFDKRETFGPQGGTDS